MPLFNTSMGGSTPKTLVTPDGITDSIAIEKVDGKTVKPSSTLGNATADKVLQGATFTSDGGFSIAGTSTAAIDLEAAQGEIADLEGQLNDANTTLQDALFLGESKLGASPAYSQYWGGCAYGKGVYIAVYQSSNYLYGTDKNGWVTKNAGSSIDRVVFGNNKFIAIKTSGNYVLSSSDGVKWTKTTSLFNTRKLSFANGLFFITGSGNGELASSTDGVSWTKITGNVLNRSLYKVAYGNGIYVMAAGNLSILYSTDAKTWKRATVNKYSSAYDYYISDIAYGNGYFFTNVYGQVYYYSEDGKTWDPYCIDYDVYTSLGSSGDVVYGNGIFAFSSNQSSSGSRNIMLVQKPYDDAGISVCPTGYYKPIVSFVNGKFIVMFNLYNSSSSNLLMYSYDGFYWMNSLSKTIKDNNGTDKTQELFYQLKGISLEALSVAYAEGVNSYE